MTNPNLAYEFLTGRPPAPTWRRRASVMRRPWLIVAWLRRLYRNGS